MHNNRYSTGEGGMRLFTVDHPQITLSLKGGGGTRRPPPWTCYVLFRPQPLSPAHSWFLVGTTWSPGTSSLYATTYGWRCVCLGWYKKLPDGRSAPLYNRPTVNVVL